MRDEQTSTREGQGPVPGRRVSRRWLVNALNRANFLGGSVKLAFRHAASGSTISVSARPEPCLGRRLSCSWIRRPRLADDRESWSLLHVHLTDGLSQFEIPACNVGWYDAGISLELPEIACDVTTRRSKRHPCSGVRARVDLAGVILDGRLESSSAASFSVRLAAAPAAPLPGESLAVELVRGKKSLFTSYCTVVRSARGGAGTTLVLKPPAAAGARERRTRYRRLRPGIAPLPLIVFRHPLSGTPVTLRALDVSGAGFSVEEEASLAQLLPGLLLPRVRIEVASGFEFPCSARVVYNEPTADGGLRSGLAIETMRLGDHTRLTALLHLRLYRQLYNRSPRIARHIIYQERGAILGHIAMFRWFPATWILHHHAALTSARHRAGLVVMERMMRYIQEFHRLFPAMMRYVACYYRPGNRFGARAFGGAARALGKRRCSLDDFAYFHLREAVAPAPLPRGWSLVPAAASDLVALRDAYARDSGGLMIEGLSLREVDPPGETALSAEYARLGFRRARRLHALRRDGRCAALIAVNCSDIGLNLSDLTNGLQAFVVEPDELPARVLSSALATLAAPSQPGGTSVLLYPRRYADERGVAYDKGYELVVLDLEHIGPLLDFLDDLLAPARRSRTSIVAG